MSSESIDAVFHALSDPTRRAVMSSISQRGQASATEIAEQLPISRQAVAKHLAALGKAGLVAHERRGRDKFYRLTPHPLGEALSWMADVGAEWDVRLKALETLLNRSFRR
jgi:DNA-binding transcriptional ArsR family regulator